MDTDPGGYFSNSTLFKTSLLTIAFTSFYIYKTDKKIPLFKQPVVVSDSVAVVKLPPVVVKKKKTIYLTFDDGPNKGTRKVMDILNREHIPATLFIIGEHVYGSHGQREIYDSLRTDTLIEIANHSFTHAFENKFRAFYEQPDSVVKDFKRCADSLHLQTGIVRTPGRNIWRTSSVNSTDIADSREAADSLRSNGFTAVGWDLEWHFTGNNQLVQSDTLLLKQVDSAFTHNRTKSRDKLVLLAHDQAFLSSADSGTLHRFISELKRRDEYNFEIISKYGEAVN